MLLSGGCFIQVCLNKLVCSTGHIVLLPQDAYPVRTSCRRSTSSFLLYDYSTREQRGRCISTSYMSDLLF